MQFIVKDSLPIEPEIDTIYLLNNNWDDWFEFETQYELCYVDKNKKSNNIGFVKIGQFSMKQGQRRATIPPIFEKLNNQFFSLGQDDSYYVGLNDFGNVFSHSVLTALNDIALNTTLYNMALNERVTKISLLREVPKNLVKGQFHRIASGYAHLTNYDFKYIAPKVKNSLSKNLELEFNVIAESNPPTNIHVLIGRNGVGKTHLLNNMIDSLLSDEKTTKYGIFTSDSEQLFANVVFVTFSAFDESEPMKELKDTTKNNIPYSYIGLKRISNTTTKSTRPKSPTMLKNEFIKSLISCTNGAKKNRWIEAISVLESDPMFKESEIINIIEIKDIDELKKEASDIFNKLSSGHKIVLLSITRLVETVREKTLILLDEPESHLHPPLLGAFTRSLSNLLINQNGVAIVATHSPVILQEVPKNCVWKINRSGISSNIERLEIESFGENVGALTQEVFGLEVTRSGFYNIIKDVVNQHDNYESVKSHFNGQLGMEARALTRALVASKKKL